ncbi:hypothetical protein [Laspinema olomoucense]|uniref:SRCR domain-containing protein n=1 Tax=Laspinema olomoucense D3b TaxID=2953688 RepID=A0ABT2NCG8_9CYAN|nr:hypothetical protein [Laspinema sp. D3b]MCT7980398.1 hypothetical protein [Laspinema sp. D3b]
MAAVSISYAVGNGVEGWRCDRHASAANSAVGWCNHHGCKTHPDNMSWMAVVCDWFGLLDDRFQRVRFETIPLPTLALRQL